MSNGFSTEAKLGLFVIIALAVLAWMSIQMGVLRMGEAEGYKVYFMTDNASGLKHKAPVLMAGIRIGSVEAIDLVDRQARLTLIINHDVQIPADSTVSLNTQGILGDAYVKIVPGTEQALAPEARETRLTNVQAQHRLEDLAGSLGEILDDLKIITSSLKISLASTESQDNIQASLVNIKEITDALRLVIAGNEDRMVKIVTNLERFTASLNQITARIESGQGSLGGLINERETLDDLNATLASLKSVTQKIDEGQGSLGKLVNDDETVTRLDDALLGINDYISQGERWRLGVDYRGEWNFREEAMRNTLNVRLQPSADKFFLLGVVDDPRGQREDTYTREVTTVNGQSQVVERRVSKIEDDQLGFNAQFGKRFYDLTVRGGLFNSSGGLGLDYNLLDDRLTFTLEASEFRRDENPRLRLAADYKFWKYFYLTAGWDDLVSSTDQDNFFLGAGITFYDDDLKYLLTNAPIP
ncbi:MAG: MlaD family protein [Desulfarculales bacterium]|jgi:phospholipid/cholesterol/gamma-HCH transport system substrate-binding protein|nr:MlaD family protein [Desulfarculales bacterium]